MAWWSWFWPFGRKEEEPRELSFRYGHRPDDPMLKPAEPKRDPSRPVSVPYQRHDAPIGTITATSDAGYTRHLHVPSTTTYTPPAFDGGHSISHSHCDAGHSGDGGSGCDGGGAH